MKRLAAPLFAAAVFAVGCTDAPIVLPRAIADIRVGPSQRSGVPSGACGFDETAVSIGCAGASSKCAGAREGLYLPVAHGSAIEADGKPASTGDEVHVYCSVVSSGSLFDVKLSVLRVDPKNPNRNTQKVTIYGTLAPTREAQSVIVTTSSTTTASFAKGESGCTISFPEGSMGVASGRIWGVVDCPDAVVPTQPDRICRVGGIVRFENCGE
jgi:hypothetical protein